MLPFGSKAYVVNTDISKKKFNSRAKVGLLVGYQEEANNYRIYDQDKRIIFTARDVAFNPIEEQTSTDIRIPISRSYSKETQTEKECLNQEESISMEIDSESESDSNYIVQEEQMVDHVPIIQDTINIRKRKADTSITTPLNVSLRDRTKIKRPIFEEANYVHVIEPVNFEEAVTKVNG